MSNDKSVNVASPGSGDPGRQDLGKVLSTPADCDRADQCASGSIERLYEVFAASARRWELIVYPALFAFIILAAYGFFLIYSLTKDVNQVAANMSGITDSMMLVAERMEAVSDHMAVITGDVGQQPELMEEMVVSMRDMNRSMTVVSGSVDQMRHDISIMNHSVSRPMSMMNRMMPW